MFIISTLTSDSVTSIEICKLFPYRRKTSIWINLVSKYGIVLLVIYTCTCTLYYYIVCNGCQVWYLCGNPGFPHRQQKARAQNGLFCN